MRLFGIALTWLLLFGNGSVLAAPEVQLFSPTGTTKAVRQVQVRFSAPMVALGDPRLPAPFVINCPEPGTARWADPRNWIYDFARDLPAGVTCRFTLKPTLVTAAGGPLAGSRTFTFNTGGPSILQSEPSEGSPIDEAQIFILGLDAPAIKASIEANVHCRVDGVTESVGVRVVDGDERRDLLNANPDFVRRYGNVLFKDRGGEWMVATSIAEEGTVHERFLQLMHAADSPIVLVQCKQHLPNGAKTFLDWGIGVSTASGVATAEAQVLEFVTREAFRATFHCERVNKDANCIPALGMSLDFTSAIATADALKISLTDSAGKIYPVRSGADAKDAWTSGVSFGGAFPEHTKFTLALPPALHDDAGRSLVNDNRFPLTVTTDADPPLAKFAADFGILELHGNPALPVTVRNLEANLSPRQPAPLVAAPSVGGFVRDLLGREEDPLRDDAPVPQLKGKVLQFAADDPVAIGGYLTAVRGAARDEYLYDDKTERYVVSKHAGATALIRDDPKARALVVPRATHAKAFEVIGIPLPDPGFYLVELESPRLGASLFGKPGTYYVQSLALVTNLGVHFKWGRESSLVWVTALDTGKPVPHAAVTLKDCAGTIHWQGTSDQHGVAAIDTELPRPTNLPRCAWNSQGLIATAKLGADIGLVASEWNEGIANWNFNLPSAAWRNPEIATTVFDRTLFRAGETVHMKHLLREHTRQGFAAPVIQSLTVRIRHDGTDDEYPVTATFDPDSASGESNWLIPKDAKQGKYYVEYQADNSWVAMGDFRVESYRVPLLRATLESDPKPAVAAAHLGVAVQVNYLAGGPAGGLPIKLRGVVHAREITFPDYDNFVFMNGNVKEGLVDQAEQAWRYQPYQSNAEHAATLSTVRATLDAQGGGRLQLTDLPHPDTAQILTAELEYSDPNGEILTSSTRVPLWPAHIILGIKPNGWALSKDDMRFQVLALDVMGKPVAAAPITVDLLQRITYSHRKRLLGGFYAYENKTEIKKIGGAVCTGTTDALGLLSCHTKSAVSGNVILRAQSVDGAGHESYANRDVWVAGADNWWYPVSNEDRMEVLPEKKRYEPGETARFQVRMPFREATALVSVEREGIIERSVTTLSGKSPVIEIPIAGNYAPNVFVSVLAVRGRDAATQPTALVDLGRPAYKLGVAEIRVGWRAHELKVKVSADHPAYKVRGTAVVDIAVTAADGSALGPHAEVVLAAVDEGLLDLRANESWNLLETMMERRGAEVETSTAQMQVIGKRHFGRKAVAPGGGGGTAAGTRQLFDTLLKWQTRIPLDPYGHARVEIPLNDSLTSFRVTAVASDGLARFGTGATSIQSTQDLMLFAGLPPLVREGDRFRAGFTVRNASDRALSIEARPSVEAVDALGATTAIDPNVLPSQQVNLAAGAAEEVAWDLTAPADSTALRWQLRADDPATPSVHDALSITQLIVPAIAVRTFQATIAQLTAPLTLPVARPLDAIPGRGGLQLTYQARLGADLAGVREYMTFYDYACLEQLVSKAVALQDPIRWQTAMGLLPSYLDGNGLAKYFAVEGPGDDTLTTYILAIAAEAGFEIPESARARMRKGLVQFIEGRVTRESALKTADLSLRKLAAIEALSRYPEGLEARWLESLDITPTLWPTSGLIDWIDILRRTDSLPRRAELLDTALGLLRARINFQGTSMSFSTEKTDALWWLMISADVNANRALLSVLDQPVWADDIPRLVTGSLGRQQHGHWSTTNANAWGVLAMKKFSAKFEAKAVTGTTAAKLDAETHTHSWASHAASGEASLAWPIKPAYLEIAHAGEGAPWMTLQARAAIPLKAPLQSGYTIKRTITPLAQANAGAWQRGDVYRVRLELEAQSDMTWVVVRDPIPSGASILGSGLGHDSEVMTEGQQREGWVWPAFEERTFESFRAYFRFVPKGNWTVEYTVRLNTAGEFYLPETRVEAMYAPEMFAESPNQKIVVAP